MTQPTALRAHQKLKFLAKTGFFQKKITTLLVAEHELEAQIEQNQMDHKLLNYFE